MPTVPMFEQIYYENNGANYENNGANYENNGANYEVLFSYS